MFRRSAVLLGAVLLFGPLAVTAQVVDLSEKSALEQLRSSNPAHYEKIRRIVAGLTEQPSRAEGDWLAATFGATDVVLGRLVFMTSNPPKQTLEFKLDATQYRLHVVRSDLTPEGRPLGQPPRRWGANVEGRRSARPPGRHCAARRGVRIIGPSTGGTTMNHWHSPRLLRNRGSL